MAETEKVTLARAYLWVPEGERDAVSYGPGEVEIPKAMADGLRRANVLVDAKPAAATAAPQGIAFLQEAGYDDMNVLEAIEYLQSLTETERRIALQHERKNKNRGTVLKEFN